MTCGAPGQRDRERRRRGWSACSRRASDKQETIRRAPVRAAPSAASDRASSSASRWLFASPLAMASSSVERRCCLRPRSDRMQSEHQSDQNRGQALQRAPSCWHGWTHFRAASFGVIRSMKTSSSDAAIGRTLTSPGCPAARAPDRIDAARSAPLPDDSDVGAVAERLHVCDAGQRGERLERRTRRIRHDLEQLPAEALPAASPGASSASRLAVVQQRDARAALGLVQVRRRHHDRQTAARGTRTAASRTRGATPDRRRSSARRAAGSCGSCTSVQASASFCFMPPDSRSARRARNGVSCVISSSRSRAGW